MPNSTLLRERGLAGVADLGSWVYRTAPLFWRRYSEARKRPIVPAPFRPKPGRWKDSGLHAAWLGHATVLLKLDGVTILTDPVFSPAVGLDFKVFTVGVKRLVRPALMLQDLPHIDVVLLSHAHFDHFDLPSLRRLENRGTAVITPASTADLLRVKRYGSVTELHWGERVKVGPVEVRAFQVNHWGARMRTDGHRGYNGYTIESGRHRVLFGGDTALTRNFRSLKSSRPFDMAIMPVGAYNPWIRYHCTPEQALQMADDAGAEMILPIHHQTFPLSQEPVLEPIERLYGAVGRHQDRVALTRIGQESSLS